MSTAPDPADHDLDLAVELVNTYWVLASPPDRLTSIGAYQRILREAGEDNLAGQLGPADLPGLRGLRDSLHPVFAAGPAADAVALVDALLREAAVPARLTTAARAEDGAARGHRYGACARGGRRGRPTALEWSADISGLGREMDAHGDGHSRGARRQHAAAALAAGRPGRASAGRAERGRAAGGGRPGGGGEHRPAARGGHRGPHRRRGPADELDDLESLSDPPAR